MRVEHNHFAHKICRYEGPGAYHMYSDVNLVACGIIPTFLVSYGFCILMS